MFKKNYLLSILIIFSIILISACASPSETEELTSANNLTQTSINQGSSTTLGESRPEAKTRLYFFWGEGCPYCDVQKVFLEKMQDKYPDLEIKMYETWKNRGNAQILQDMAQAYGTRASGVPMTFIGDFNPMVGFASHMEKELEDKIIFCLEEDCPDPGDKL